MKSKVLTLLLCSVFFFINTNINVSAANTYTSNIQSSIQITYENALKKRQSLVQRKTQIQRNVSSTQIIISQLQTDLKNIATNEFIGPTYPSSELQQLYQNYFYLHQQLTDTQNKLSELTTQQNLVTTQKLQLQENLSNTSQNIASLNQTISSYNSEMDTTNISLHNITTQLTNLSTNAPNYAQLTLQLQQLVTQKNVLEQEILSAQSNLKQLQLNTQNTSDSLLKLEQQFTELDSNLVTQKNLVAKLDQEFNQAKQTYIAKLNYYLAIENNSLSELQTVLNQLTEQQLQLTFQISSLEQNLHKSNKSTSLSKSLDSDTSVAVTSLAVSTNKATTSSTTSTKKQIITNNSSETVKNKENKIQVATSHKSNFLLQLLAVAFVIGGAAFFYKSKNS